MINKFNNEKSSNYVIITLSLKMLGAKQWTYLKTSHGGHY